MRAAPPAKNPQHLLRLRIDVAVRDEHVEIAVEIRVKARGIPAELVEARGNDSTGVRSIVSCAICDWMDSGRSGDCVPRSCARR